MIFLQCSPAPSASFVFLQLVFSYEDARIRRYSFRLPTTRVPFVLVLHVSGATKGGEGAAGGCM